MKPLITNEDIDNIPIDDLLKAFYQGIVISIDFSDKVIIRVMDGIINPPLRDRVLMEIYKALHLWGKTAKTLEHPRHFQAMASIARSMFELVLDLKLITTNKIDRAIEKYEAHAEVARFKVASSFKCFKEEHPEARTAAGKHKIALASDPAKQSRVSELSQLWGGKIPDHWSGWGIFKRAEEAGLDYEAFYHESYRMLCWYVHAGLTGTRKMSLAGLQTVYGNSTRLICDIFIEAILIVSRELSIDLAVPEFNKLVKQIHGEPGRVLLEAHKNYIKDMVEKS